MAQKGKKIKEAPREQTSGPNQNLGAGINPKLEIALLLGICLATFICFSYTLSNQFLYWDDNQYIVNDIYIRRFTWENIKYLFSHDFGANWQPLTMLSYSLNYHFSKFSPGGYFLTNVLLHVANTALVFLVIKKLASLWWKDMKSAGQLTIAGIVSLWFGIHPMHVESVGWLFERKDVLYTFFYLSAMLSYLHYSSNGKIKFLFYTFLLFGLSCMSKPMAVVFPAALLLIDFVLNGKIVRKHWIEKIPFFLVSLLMGFYTLHTQSEAHAFTYSFSFIDKIVIASYSFLAYIYKLILPINLCGFYPYPVAPGQSMPGIYYLAPLGVLLIAALPLYITFKKNKTLFYVLAFGFGFYLINLVLVMQFFSVGSAIISDRYSYMSYIGLLFIPAYFINDWFQRGSLNVKNVIATIVLAFTGVFGYLCYQRTAAWHDTEAMLGDVIAQYPEKVPQAYKYLGIYYARANRNQDAYNCYNTLINKMHLPDADAYCNMGRVMMTIGNMKEAARYLNASLQIDSNLFMSYQNLGVICADSGNFNGALQYYARANRIYANDEGLHNNIAAAYTALKQYDKGIEEYNFIINMDPDNPLHYFNRAVAEYGKADMNAAISDFLRTYTMQPTPETSQYHLNSTAANNLAIIYKAQGDNTKADFYAGEAKRLGGK